MKVETAVEGSGGRSFEVEATSDLVVGGHVFAFDNRSGLSTEVLLESARVGPNPYVREGATMREVASTLSRWVDNARAAVGRTSMFDRGAYTPPENPYDEMRAARNAMRYDSVVSGVGEITEAYAFQGLKWEGKDPDEADVFNQLAIDQELDSFMRAAWKEEYAYGQFVAAKSWGYREYTVRGETEKGNKRKRTFRVYAPLKLTILDSASVVPVGLSPITGYSLCWQAIPGEVGYYDRADSGAEYDPMMTAFFTGRYEPNYIEAGLLGRMGVDTSNLLMMNPGWVFRHTLTKPDYERFPDIRLKSVFRLLDLKQRLMESDRAMLIGAANYILLVRKGLKDEPAQPEEMDSLKANFNFIAKLPVIISDHRLEIDIISPKTDHTLEGQKYDVLDQRILSRLLGTLTVTTHGSGRSENQETLALSVARVMENRRHMMRRTLEREIARAVVRHPRNQGVFDTEPNLVFTPRNIALAMDQQYIMGLLQLRTNREISRETILEYFGLDESVEAMRVQVEKDMYDDIFQSLVAFSGAQPGQPGSDPAAPAPTKKAVGTTTTGTGGTAAGAKKTTAAPAKAAPVKKAAPAKKTPAKRTSPNGGPESPRAAGQRGGRPVGGGRTPQSPQKQMKPRTRKGNPSTRS